MIRVKESLVQKKGQYAAAGVAIIAVMALGTFLLLHSHAATIAVAGEAENGTASANASIVNDTAASGGKAVRFTSASSSQGCTNPAFTTSQQFGTWNYAPNVLVNNNVWGPSGTGWSQTLSACSPASWYINAKFAPDGGAIQTYPDTEYNYSGKTIAQYTSIQSCFDESGPIPAGGGEWDWGYDNWLNNFGIEVMVWNNWTDTGIYPPSNARAVSIDGVGYHTWKGGGSNEWIYTRDTIVQSGCVNLLHVFQDLVAHPGSSGMTNSSVPNAVEYGIEIAATNGTQKFQVNNFTVTAQ